MKVLCLVLCVVATVASGMKLGQSDLDLLKILTAKIKENIHQTRQAPQPNPALDQFLQQNLDNYTKELPATFDNIWLIQDELTRLIVLYVDEKTGNNTALIECGELIHTIGMWRFLTKNININQTRVEVGTAVLNILLNASIPFDLVNKVLRKVPDMLQVVVKPIRDLVYETGGIIKNLTNADLRSIVNGTKDTTRNVTMETVIRNVLSVVARIVSIVTDPTFASNAGQICNRTLPTSLLNVLKQRINMIETLFDGNTTLELLQDSGNLDPRIKNLPIYGWDLIYSTESLWKPFFILYDLEYELEHRLNNTLEYKYAYDNALYSILEDQVRRPTIERFVQTILDQVKTDPSGVILNQRFKDANEKSLLDVMGKILDIIVQDDVNPDCPAGKILASTAGIAKLGTFNLINASNPNLSPFVSGVENEITAVYPEYKTNDKLAKVLRRAVIGLVNRMYSEQLENYAFSICDITQAWYGSDEIPLKVLVLVKLTHPDTQVNKVLGEILKVMRSGQDYASGFCPNITNALPQVKSTLARFINSLKVPNVTNIAPLVERMLTRICNSESNCTALRPAIENAIVTNYKNLMEVVTEKQSELGSIIDEDITMGTRTFRQFVANFLGELLSRTAIKGGQRPGGQNGGSGQNSSGGQQG